MNDQIQQDISTLRTWVEEAAPGKVVFFGGAGVSTESGIPDFRSADGLYSLHFKYPPETMLSHSFFQVHPDEFYRFYFDRVVATDAEPNRAHKKLAELEKAGLLSAVITQNIDGLHQAAGSQNVLELHGSVARNYCMSCGHQVSVDDMIRLHEESLSQGGDGVPLCPVCGGMLRPDVVLYEEGLDQEVLEASVRAIANADVMIVAGTSLVVNPAASLIRYYGGNKLAIVNKSTTPYDRVANLVIPASIGDALDW